MFTDYTATEVTCTASTTASNTFTGTTACVTEVLLSPGVRSSVPGELLRRPPHSSVSTGDPTRTRRFVFTSRCETHQCNGVVGLVWL